MPSDVDLVLERLRQSRAVRVAAGPAFAAFVAERRPTAGLSFAPGDRVFDTVSGEEGVIVGGTRENVVVPTTR